MGAYYLAVDGRETGPFQLHDLPTHGLAPDSMVWQEGMADWKEARFVPETAALLPQPVASNEAKPALTAVPLQPVAPPPPLPLPPPLPAMPPALPAHGTPPTWVPPPIFPAATYPAPAYGSVPHGLGESSVVGMYLLTFLTAGIYAFFHFNLMHDRLPKVRRDDPSGGKAIGFHFIPIFNIYWLCFVHLRLVDRINEQRRLAGLPESSVKGFLVTTLILHFIPILNFAGPLLFLTYYGWVQYTVNELARCSRR